MAKQSMPAAKRGQKKGARRFALTYSRWISGAQGKPSRFRSEFTAEDLELAKYLAQTEWETLIGRLPKHQHPFDIQLIEMHNWQPRTEGVQLASAKTPA